MTLYLPNGKEVEQGSPEDKATWWRCTICFFTGPNVGSIGPRGDTKRCIGSCKGIHKNPNVPRLTKPTIEELQ